MTQIELIAHWTVFIIIILLLALAVYAAAKAQREDSKVNSPLIHRHDWSRWETDGTIKAKNIWDDDAHYIPYYDTQRRKCAKCGKEQIRREYY